MSKLPIPKKLGQGQPYTLPSEKVQYFDLSHHVGFFPVGIFFTQTYNCFPCILHVERIYTEGLLDFLREKGKLFSDSATVKNLSPKTISTDPYSDNFDMEDEGEDYKGTFLYKDTVISFSKATTRKSKKQKKQPLLFNITIYYKPNSDSHIKDFDKFLHEEKYNSVIHTIFRDEHGGIIFEPFETVVPDHFSIEKYYEKDFKPVHEHIVNNLKKDESGLYLLHGPPGTGKTTYIKYLSTLIDRDIIYVPVAFIDSLSDPSFLPALLKKRHSILVIEDAEKALLAREPGDAAASLVSAILNITDGIMGNVFSISIIATYNSKRQDIDKALLRKGRLKAEYKFDKLSVEQCKQIVKDNKINFNVTEPMTLAEIFNTDIPDILITPELKEEKRMGFC